jgi:uncharacterized protein YcbK (DUF882 family)
LVTKVNALLYELNIEAKVSSGFRPSGINGKIKNAAKFSNHLNGFALDLEDPEDELDHVFELNLHLLEKHGLYLESPQFTKGWAHLQSVPPKSGKRVFNP